MSGIIGALGRTERHSYRKASNGSIFAARRAGIKIASAAVTISRREANAKVSGSVDWIPYT
jgi:hypothetical protein